MEILIIYEWVGLFKLKIILLLIIMKIVEIVATGSILAYTVKRMMKEDYRVVYVIYSFSCLREIAVFRDVYKYKPLKSKNYITFGVGVD